MVGSMALYKDDPKGTNRFAWVIVIVFLGMFFIGSLLHLIQSDERVGFYTIGDVKACKDSLIVVKSILNNSERLDTFFVAAFSDRVFLHYQAGAESRPSLVVDTIPLDFLDANGEKLKSLAKDQYRIVRSDLP